VTEDPTGAGETGRVGGAGAGAGDGSGAAVNATAAGCGGGTAGGGAGTAGTPTPAGAPDSRIALAPGATLDPRELRWRFSTSGGPGGQHVNTSNTRAEVTFDIAGSTTMPRWARDRLVERLGRTVTVAARDRRSQARNRDLALERLVARLRAALEERAQRRATRPTKASQRRRVDMKRQRGDLKRERQRGRGGAGREDD
jgi:ribosome-associated protein